MAINNSNHQEQLRERILDYSMKEFLHRGIRAVKMDNIAADLQVSKRTLYEMFEDKEHLLIESIRHNHKVHQRRIDEYAAQANNPLEVFAFVFNMKMEEVHEVNPQFISDAKRNASINAGFEEETARRNADTIKFIDHCVQLGLFRPELNYNLIMRMFDLTNRTMIENEFYKEFPMEEIIYLMYETFVRSICTPKGLEILDRYIKTYRHTQDSSEINNHNKDHHQYVES